MAIEFRCSSCDRLLRVPDEAAGKRAKCPQCGVVLSIPLGEGPSGAAAAGAPPPVPPSKDDNPFRAPSAPTFGPGMPSRSLDLADILSRTWQIFQPQIGTSILAALVVGLVVAGAFLAVYLLAGVLLFVTRSGALSVLMMMVGIPAVMVLAIAMHLGLLRIFLKIARGQQARLGELFVMDPQFLPFLGVSLLVGLIVSAGTMLCVVPGVIFFLILSQSQLLVVDRNLPVFESLNRSKEMTDGTKLNLFLIWLVAGIGAGVINAVTCGLGSIVSAPFLLLMTAVIYLTLSGEPTAEMLGRGQ
jgi:uncharacterized membrane protein